MRHKRDDEDRSSEYDKLIVAEQSYVLYQVMTQVAEGCSAAAEGRGLHSSKDVSLPRVVDASESSSRASQYLPSWKRAGRHPAVVDFVNAGSRYKLFMPKENAKITFVLAGESAKCLLLFIGRHPRTTDGSKPE